MSKYYKTNCPECGSKDNLAVYEDGHSYCFTPDCGYKKDDNNMASTRLQDVTVDSVPRSTQYLSVNDIADYPSYPMGSRKISRDIVDLFKVRMSVNEDGKPEAHYYPYTRDGKITAYKVRQLPKDFSVVGDFKNVELFGQSTCGGGKTLVVTEGEIDAMAVAEAFKQHYGRIFPVVSIPSASGTNVLLAQREWIRNFESVVILFDQDEAGKTAAEKAAKIIGLERCKIGTMQQKDASETLIEGGHAAVLSSIWNAKPWSPAGIMYGDSIWDAFMERQSVESIPYPACMDGLNQKLKGIRHGEITLFTSGTGSGKSTVIKEIILDLLTKTDDKIGLISLEESVGDTAEKFISMALGRPLSDPPPLTEEQLRSGFDEVFGDERLVLLDHQGSVGDSSLIDKIEYMALSGCRYLVLDHITIAVSEGSEGLSGNEAIDKVMSDLLKIVKRHNIWLGLISHLRKSMGGKSFEEGNLASIDDIKGSGSIKQISFDIVAFARNLVATDEAERNTIKFRVLKSRFTGLTGDAGLATYNQQTCRLIKAGDFDVQDFEI